jgi:hypothetical protein
MNIPYSVWIMAISGTVLNDEDEEDEEDEKKYCFVVAVPLDLSISRKARGQALHLTFIH